MPRTAHTAHIIDTFLTPKCVHLYAQTLQTTPVHTEGEMSKSGFGAERRCQKALERSGGKTNKRCMRPDAVIVSIVHCVTRQT